jgi:hypothetical protein
MYHFCTYFDRNYLVRGLALYWSLVRHASPFTLYVLCLDGYTRDLLARLGLPEVRLIPIEDFEAGDADLVEAKNNRRRIEYYFTCTPSLPLYVLDHFPGIDVITYLDADLYFFADPAPVYDELRDRSILIVEHRFPEHLRHLEVYGLYNVGLLCFRNDRHGRECLRWWRQCCLRWCGNRVNGAAFADQKYLDDWPARFPGVVVLQHKGANLAPWNVDRFCLRERNGSVLVDGDPLIFYHFHRLQIITRFFFDPDLALYDARLSPLLRRKVYAPYLRELQSCMRQLAPDPVPTLRYTTPYSVRDLLHRVMRNKTLVVVGPLSAELRLESTAGPLLDFLEPLASPLGRLGRWALRRLGVGRAKV